MKRGAGDRASPTSICLEFDVPHAATVYAALSPFDFRCSLQHGGHGVTSAFQSLMSLQPQAKSAYVSGGLSLTVSSTWQEKMEKMQSNVKSNSNPLGEWFWAYYTRVGYSFIYHVQCAIDIFPNHSY